MDSGTGHDLSGHDRIRRFAKADLIKTHHNRVAGIQKLIDEKRIIEPLASFYKDEVRAIGRTWACPRPFWTAIRSPVLAWPSAVSVPPKPSPEQLAEGWLIPVNSVGVQGDSRTYKPILSITGENLHERASELTNRLEQVNRVVTAVGTAYPMAELSVQPSTLTPERLERLRHADAIVRRISDESGFEKKVWQFPVVVIPVGTADAPDSIVLRPIDSVDGMTAESVVMEPEAAEAPHGRGTRCPRNRGGILRSNAQAPRHNRVGVNPPAQIR